MVYRLTGISHEVQRPSFVEFHRYFQGLPLTRDDSFLGLALETEPNRKVHVANLLMVSFMPIRSMPMKAFPKARTTPLTHHLVERSNH